MSFRVIILPQAVNDFESCVAFVGSRSSKGEKSLRAAFAKATKALEENAETHGLAPESANHDVPIRQTFFRTKHGRPYRLLYTVHDKTAYLLHVRGPGQDNISPDEMKLM